MAKSSGLMTDVAIRKLKQPRKAGARRETYEVSDGGAKGLRVFVGLSGAKSFIVRFRSINGKSQKLTLGPYCEDLKTSADPKVGDPLTLASARMLAAQVMLQIGRGLDPVAMKRRATEAKRQAAADTFEAIATEYLKRVCGMKVDAEDDVTFDRDKKRTGYERWLMLRRSVFPEIGRRPITEIRRKDVVRLLDKIEDERGRIASDRTLALLSTIFNWHAKRDDDFATPIVKGMARDERTPEERRRKRTLDDDELRIIWKVSGEIQGPFPALLRFLLLTGSRRDEASAMPWEEIDGADWTLPEARNKTKLDLVRPLSEAAQAVLEGLPRIEDCAYAFTNDGRRPLSGYSKAKRLFDESVLAELRKQDPKAEPLENWTLHDLRRTARSLMSRAGVIADHAERSLGHVIGGVRGIYDRFEFYDEKRDAFERLAKLIAAIVDPPPANVLPFQKIGENA